ncbi:hypothetical protein BEP19_09495 [Ammoniphilus oxalaticus]|uniref:Uncharacterized protein n=1 Tax=Ammoniphilus oxalaticus TaxID=66863 RepID=A0A419SKR5_9BACL|nr:hypothetical protein [Ammoniphilus oxalaticus]RKD24601.1 hypothetical protein BEP19_09495 [Ammoniphilus oxalaticus]
MKQLSYNIISKEEQTVGENINLINVDFTVEVESQLLAVSNHPIYFTVVYYVNKISNEIDHVEYVGTSSANWEAFIVEIPDEEYLMIDKIMFHICEQIDKLELAKVFHS